MAKNEPEAKFETLFPRAQLLEVFAELGAWTRVGDVLKAARLIENRLSHNEGPIANLILTFPDDDIFEAVFVQILDLFFNSYQCPQAKLVLAMQEDPRILVSTCQTLEASRLKVTMRAGKPNQLRAYYPEVPEHVQLRFFKIEDQPHVLELAAASLQVLRQMVVVFMTGALNGAQLKAKYAELTGGGPTIFHKHSSDGRLPAVLEALIFYACGHLIGYCPSVATMAIDYGYRHVALVGYPPFDERLIRAAKDAQVNQFKSIEA